MLILEIHTMLHQLKFVTKEAKAMSPFNSLFIPEVTSQHNKNSLLEQLKLLALIRTGFKTKFNMLSSFHISAYAKTYP
jgi:hypothetical protein